MSKQFAAPGETRPAPARSPVAVVLPVLVVLATVALIWWSLWPTLRPAQEVRVVQVLADQATAPEPAPAGEAGANEFHSGGERTVQAPGWLEAEPYLTACTALAPGVVDAIHVLEGDRVSKGQVVATLVRDDAELRVERAGAALKTAQANVASAEADQRAAATTWDEPFELHRAADTARASLAEARAERTRLDSVIAAANATLMLLEEELDRAEDSFAGLAAAELEVVRARQRAGAQRATVRAHEAERPLLDARIQRFEAELRAAERDLELRIADRRRLEAAAADLARAQAERDAAGVALREAELELSRMTIRAPIDGYVQRRLKVPGDKIMFDMDSPHSAHVLHLYEPAKLQVRVDVPLADAAQVFVGQRCEVVVEVLPDVTFAGRVLRVTHEADLQKNTLQAKVAIDDPSPLLRPEMLTRVKFLERSAPADGPARPSSAGAVFLVPSSAIDSAGGTPEVSTVVDREQDRGVIRRVGVELVSATDGWSRVRGPLHAGVLVAEPPGSVRTGDAVRLKGEDSE